MSLDPTLHVESTHPEVVAFAHESICGATEEREKAVALYYAVRDGVRYNPYTFDVTSATLCASYTLKARRSWCVPKAVLLAACCRALGIAARVGFADVRNHLSTKRLKQMMGTDIFAWHGYTSICIDGEWRKATPAFNLELCKKFKLMPLEFDGEHDAIHHPFDLEGRKHMEYIRFRGEYDDIPLGEMTASLRELYPGLVHAPLEDSDFHADIETN